MYNSKDIQFAGKHDFVKPLYVERMTTLTFSIGVFKWELKNNGRSMKKGKSVVRVSGLVTNSKNVIDYCEHVVQLLDKNEWDGRKTVIIK